MNKIPAEILANCTPQSCLQNEIAILPFDGDAGFEDYFFFKAEEVRKRRHLFVSKEKKALLLTYPSPPEENEDKRYSETLMERFFDSPSIFANNQIYQGCFGIDLSAYLTKTTNEKFLDLMSYIRNTPQTVYTLFAYTNNVNEAESLITAVNQYADFKPVYFSLPNELSLAKYLCDRLRDDILQIDQFVEEYVSEVFQKYKLGYDSAEYIAKAMISQGFTGTLEETKALVPQIIIGLNTRTRDNSFGY